MPSREFTRAFWDVTLTDAWNSGHHALVSTSVDTSDAMALIAGAVPQRAGTWADVGAGDGTFTRALVALLGPGSRVYAVDRDTRALQATDRWALATRAYVITLRADFTRPFEFPALPAPGLDGLLLANALHFVPDAGAVLARLVTRLRPGGRVVLVEYDGRPASRWVPYPIPVARLAELAATAGLDEPAVVATRPSAYGGVIYAAVARNAG